MTQRTGPLPQALGLLSVICAGSANAEWYVGGSVGQSSIDVGTGEIEDAFLIDDDFVATGTSLDETDTGWKAFAGYDFTPVFALEAAYADLGEATFLATIESAPPPNDAIVPFDILGTATADGFQASALIRLPLGPVAAFAKLGAFRWEAEFTEEIVETGALRVERTEAEIDALYGAGVQLDIPGPLDARVEWERLQNVGEGIGGRSGRDIDYFSAGVVWRF